MESFGDMVTTVSSPFLDVLVKGIWEHLRLFGLKELETTFIARTVGLDLLMVMELAPAPASLICLCFDNFFLKIKPQLRELGGNLNQKDLLLEGILLCFESLEPYRQPIKSILRDLPFYPTFWKTLTDHGLIWTGVFFRNISLNVSFYQKVNWLLMMRKLVKNWIIQSPQKFLGTCDQAIRALDFN